LCRALPVKHSDFHPADLSNVFQKGRRLASWPAVAARKMCGGEVTDDSTIPPSYVELLVCLQDQQLARKLPKQ
jgi:hypothetical protein